MNLKKETNELQPRVSKRISKKAASILRIYRFYSVVRLNFRPEIRSTKLVGENCRGAAKLRLELQHHLNPNSTMENCKQKC